MKDACTPAPVLNHSPLKLQALSPRPLLLHLDSLLHIALPQIAAVEMSKRPVPYFIPLDPRLLIRIDTAVSVRAGLKGTVLDLQQPQLCEVAEEPVCCARYLLRGRQVDEAVFAVEV